MTKFSVLRAPPLGLKLAAVSALALMIAGTAQADTLADAIAMAYAQNPTLARQRAEQRATDEGYVQTRSELGPNLGVGATADYTDHSAAYVGRSTTTVDLTASQTLFASGRLSATVDASKANVLAGQQDLRSTESSVLLDVISVYTAVRRDQQALQISQDNRDILKQQLDQTQAQFDAGQLTKTDVAQSQARLSASEASLAEAQAQLDTDRASYVAVVGQAPTALDPEPDLPGLPTDYDAALSTAQSNNPDLQAAQYAAHAAHANVAAARSAFGPTVALTAGSSEFAPTHRLGDLGDNEEATATLSLNIPLYSSGLNSSRVRQALEDEDAQQQTVELTRRNVVSQVSSAWSQMIAARSAVVSNQAGVNAAQVAADGIKTEQQVGLRTNIEVLNAEQDLKTAQLALIDAQRQQYVAASQLLSVTGGMTAKAFVPNIDVYDPQTHFDKVKHDGWSPFQTVTEALDGLAAGPAAK